MKLRATYVGLAILFCSTPALAQTAAPPTEPAPIVQSCGNVPSQAEHYFDINKIGNVYSKNVSGRFRMEDIGPTDFAVCNNTAAPIEIRFAKITCQNVAVAQCPVDWDNPDGSERCGGVVKNGTSTKIPAYTWGLLSGSPNPNRDECPDTSARHDLYDFVVMVKPDAGAEQMVDPQIQIDRGTFATPIVVLVGGGLLLLLAGYFAGRWLQGRSQKAG